MGGIYIYHWKDRPLEKEQKVSAQIHVAVGEARGVGNCCCLCMQCNILSRRQYLRMVVDGGGTGYVLQPKQVVQVRGEVKWKVQMPPVDKARGREARVVVMSVCG